VRKVDPTRHPPGAGLIHAFGLLILVLLMTGCGGKATGDPAELPALSTAVATPPPAEQSGVRSANPTAMARREAALATQRAAPTPMPSNPSILTNAAGDYVVLDFGQCQPGRARIDVAFGSVTFELKGRSGQFCLLDYGGEVEDPRWDGKLTTTCRVPTSLGKRQFPSHDEGVDLRQIESYCRPV
jgi:hypothetical protein